jgi:hypothetical protein
MTTDSDELHGTVIDSGYSPESENPEPENPLEPGETLDEGGEAGDSSDEDDLDDEDEDDEDEDEDEDDEVIVVESYVPGDDDPTGAADAEADEPIVTGAADAEADEPGFPDDSNVTPEDAEPADVVSVDGAAPETVTDEDAAPGSLTGLDAASDDITPAEAAATRRHAAAPAHSHAAGDSEFAGDGGLTGDADEMYRRWAAIQSSFVDDPRESVTEAATFLSEVMTTLVAKAREREQALRDEWDHEGMDTEGLRVVLRRYRAFLDRLAAL